MIVTKAVVTESYSIPGVYEPIEYTVEHIVCDICGSSDVGVQGNQESALITGTFSVVIIVAFYGGVVAGLITHGLIIFGGGVMISVIALLIYFGVMKYIERNNHWKCNACGNENIT